MLNLGKYKQFLTKNERNKVFLRKNSPLGRGIADSKWRTKKRLGEAEVGVPKLIARFKNENELASFDWAGLEGNFVVKPVTGYGGEGIIIVRKKIFNSKALNTKFQLMDGKLIDEESIRIHCQEILIGKYSLHGMPDQVLVEERIRIHPKFLSLTKSGTPDVRVIVYNKIPIMAMLRIPTEKSGGKANLQQGGIGLGIDLATGITTFGIEGKGEPVRRIYDFGKKKLIKVNGIKIPFWREILETSVKCQKAIPGLGFLGVDVVLDKEKGPMVLEVNARPGLSIQICNKAGLKSRMQKVEDIEVKSVDHAISAAKYLFGEGFFEKVEQKEKESVVGSIENVKIKLDKAMPISTKIPEANVYKEGKKRIAEVLAKVDTGAFRSSIDKDLAAKLNLLIDKNILYYRHYRSSLGDGQERPVIELTFWLKGKKITTAASVADRSKLKTKFLVGRMDLDGFIIRAR